MFPKNLMLKCRKLLRGIQLKSPRRLRPFMDLEAVEDRALERLPMLIAEAKAQRRRIRLRNL